MATDAVSDLVKLKMVDADGKTGSTSFSVAHTSGDPLAIGGVVTLIAAIEALSNCSNVGQIGQKAENNVDGTLAAASYNARDKLVVVYVDSQNVRHKVSIPDPLPTMFVAPAYEYADTSTTQWGDIVTAMEGNIVDKAGGSILVLYGYRARSRRLRAGSKKFA